MRSTLASVLLTCLVTTLLPSALGEVVFTAPVSGNTFTYTAGQVGVPISVQWRDNKQDPVITPAGLFTLDICTGSNAEIFPLLTLGTPGMSFSTANGAVAVSIPPGIGGDGKYFLKMTWTNTDGTVINFSDRFELEGMVGTFPPAMAAANLNAETDRPDPVYPEKAPVAIDSNGGDFAIPYNEQTGDVRYAPMQPRPGNSITAKNMKRLHPTSDYTIFTTKGGPPKVRTTVTQANTYAMTTVINEAAPAPMPDDDMAKFLNRWKD